MCVCETSISSNFRFLSFITPTLKQQLLSSILSKSSDVVCRSSSVWSERLVLLDGKTGLVPDLVPGFQGWKCPGTLAQTWHLTQMTQIYSNPLKFFASPCPEYPCHDVYFFVFSTKKNTNVKFAFSFPGCQGQGTWGWKRPSHQVQTLTDLLKTWCIRIFWRAPSPKTVTGRGIRSPYKLVQVVRTCRDTKCLSVNKHTDQSIVTRRWVWTDGTSVRTPQDG